jgi:hypothetical protein
MENESILDQIVYNVLAFKLNEDGTYDHILHTGKLPKGYTRAWDLNLSLDEKIRVVSPVIKEIIVQALTGRSKSTEAAATVRSVPAEA